MGDNGSSGKDDDDSVVNTANNVYVTGMNAHIMCPKRLSAKLDVLILCVLCILLESFYSLFTVLFCNEPSLLILILVDLCLCEHNSCCLS